MHGAVSGPAAPVTLSRAEGLFLSVSPLFNPTWQLLVQAGSGGSFGLLQTPGGKSADRPVLVFAPNGAYFFALVNKQLPLPASPVNQDTGDLPPGGQTHSFARTV